MHWLFLLGAIVCEVIGTVTMKFTDGMTKLIPTLWMFLFYGLSLYLMNLTVKKIDVSTAYAVWSGVGTALIVLISIFYLKEPITALKLISILLIVAGAVGLNLSGKHRLE